LCARLLQHDIRSVDNYCTGWRQNMDALFGNSRSKAVRRVMTLSLHVEVEGIHNLACPASPVQYKHTPVLTTKTGVIGAINMLGLATRLRVRTLQASTSEVYGDPEIHPRSEDYGEHVNVVGPRACYSEAKRCAQALFFDYRRQHSIAIRVAQFFNTYDPPVHPQEGRGVSNIIVRALLNKPITIYGDGRQTRSFCYADDLIDGLLMNCDQPVAEPVNLRNLLKITVLQLVMIILDLYGARGRLELLPLPKDDPCRRCPDIDRANGPLNWRPRVTPTDGLERTIGYFEMELSGKPTRAPVLAEPA
jgi:UDP-glucuronate decarboxylase